MTREELQLRHISTRLARALAHRNGKTGVVLDLDTASDLLTLLDTFCRGTIRDDEKENERYRRQEIHYEEQLSKLRDKIEALEGRYVIA